MSIAATLDPQRQKAAAAEAQKKLIWGAKAEKVALLQQYCVSSRAISPCL
jgi:hypothetical protein